MRVIESKMNDAILNRKDWSCDNTQVIYSPVREASYVMLYGNHIATITENSIELYTCGHMTKTTKSRLNAILKDHSNGDSIRQKNGEWFVITDNQTIPFFEGMILN